MEISELELSPRAEKILEAANITTIEQMTNMSINELYRMRQCGVKTINEIRQKLLKYRLTLKNDYVIIDKESLRELIKLQNDMKKFIEKIQIGKIIE